MKAIRFTRNDTVPIASRPDLHRRGSRADVRRMRVAFAAGLSIIDWIFALALVVGAGYAFVHYNEHMNDYDKAVMIGTVPALVALGWRWKPARL
ncbi:hypothetical protein WT37_01430, partial [Burkholderia territorii]